MKDLLIPRKAIVYNDGSVGILRPDEHVSLIHKKIIEGCFVSDNDLKFMAHHLYNLIREGNLIPNDETRLKKLCDEISNKGK